MKLKSILFALTIVTALFGKSQAQNIQVIDSKPLKLTIYNGPENSMDFSSVIVSGQKEAILIDAQFTLPDAEKVAAELKKTGKKLKAIFISHGDPDFYFGLEVFRKYYPKVPVYATAQTLTHIKATSKSKLAVWGPQLKSAAPTIIIFPEALKTNYLELEGKKLEILHTTASPERSFVWIPSIRTVAGGINVFGNNIHIWLADDATAAKRAAWVAVLDKISSLKPNIVIPSHFGPGAALNLTSVAYTKNYILTYEKELAKEKTSAGLISAMKKLYPTAKSMMSLELGAKVNTGEMQWH